MSTARNGPLNYTTTIEPAKSAMECIGILAGHGASAIGSQYSNGVPTGISFQIQTTWGPRQFSLPVNVDGTYAALQKAWRAGRIAQRYASKDQAQRVAWRVLKDWLEVQIALIEAGVAELAQVMLPYRLVDEGVTVWDRYVEREQQEALEASR